MPPRRILSYGPSVSSDSPVAEEVCWQAAPESLTLDHGVVHIWRARLDIAPELRFGLLSEDEQRRAKAFHFSLHRDRYIARRRFLRTVLGRYLTRPPQEIQFGYTAYGKPYLPGAAGWDLKFNLSHAEDLAVCAISLTLDVGIDVAAERLIPDVLELATNHFSEAETAAVRAASPERRSAIFLAIWTRKEAYLKGIGTGLSTPLGAFSVPMLPFGAVQIRGADGKFTGSRWFVSEIPAPARYLGAVATPASAFRVRLFSLGWPGSALG